MGLKAGAIKDLLWLLSLPLQSRLHHSKNNISAWSISVYFPPQRLGRGQLASPGKLPFKREWEEAQYSRNQVETIQRSTHWVFTETKFQNSQSLNDPNNRSPARIFVTDEVKMKPAKDFPGGPVVKNPPANARDTGSIPGPGRSHMLRSN